MQAKATQQDSFPIMSVNSEHEIILNPGTDLRLGHLGELLVKSKPGESFWKAIW